MVKVVVDYTPSYYHDTGCELSTSCLDCPLPRCKHDEPEKYSKVTKRLEKLTKLRKSQKYAM